ncbi:MAG: helix-turn-helix transcriptional regulator [Burkholderiales bacterium]
MSKTLIFPGGPAAYLTHKLSLSGKSQAEVAQEVGVRPNVITMMKQGTIRIPLTRVGKLASSLEADPAEFLAIVLGAYAPATWTAITETFDSLTLSPRERAMLDAYRAAERSGAVS